MGDNNQKQFDAGIYIKTVSGSILAFVKILEAIIAGAGIFAILFISDRIAVLSLKIAEYINPYLYYFLPNKIFNIVRNILQFPLLIPAIILLLVILDGIGVFLMRNANTGEGLVSLIHTIYWIFYIIQLVGMVLSAIRLVLGANQVNDAFSNTEGGAAVSTVIGGMGVFFFPAFLFSFLITLFMCNYHHDILIVLKTVHSERRSGCLQRVEKNHLVGRTGWFVFGAGLLLFNSILWLLSVAGNVDFVPNEILENLPKLAPIVWFGINSVICLVIFMKNFALRRCAKNFQKVHRI